MTFCYELQAVQTDGLTAVYGLKPHEMLEKCCHNKRFESSKCVKIGLRRWGSLQRSPDPQTSSWIWRTSKGGKGKGMKEGKGERREGERRGRERSDPQTKILATALDGLQCYGGSNISTLLFVGVMRSDVMTGDATRRAAHGV